MNAQSKLYEALMMVGYSDYHVIYKLSMIDRTFLSWILKDLQTIENNFTREIRTPFIGPDNINYILIEQKLCGHYYHSHIKPAIEIIVDMARHSDTINAVFCFKEWYIHGKRRRANGQHVTEHSDGSREWPNQVSTIDDTAYNNYLHCIMKGAPVMILVRHKYVRDDILKSGDFKESKFYITKIVNNYKAGDIYYEDCGISYYYSDGLVRKLTHYSNKLSVGIINHKLFEASAKKKETYVSLEIY